jgi:hypothetical protein
MQGASERPSSPPLRQPSDVVIRQPQQARFPPSIAEECTTFSLGVSDMCLIGLGATKNEQTPPLMTLRASVFCSGGDGQKLVESQRQPHLP